MPVERRSELADCVWERALVGCRRGACDQTKGFVGQPDRTPVPDRPILSPAALRSHGRAAGRSVEPQSEMPASCLSRRVPDLAKTGTPAALVEARVPVKVNEVVEFVKVNAVEESVNPNRYG